MLPLAEYKQLNDLLYAYQYYFPNLYNPYKVNWYWSWEKQDIWDVRNKRRKNKLLGVYLPSYNMILLKHSPSSYPLFSYNYLPFHELGHAVHLQIFDYKPFRFSTKDNHRTTDLYHMIEPTGGKERFADIFADTILKVYYQLPMFEYNNQMLRILRR